ncbi:unnamed protein product [Oikopleura dioica]|uniref:Transporter n=1 Tax=Oikopleura dioica TaxID=34765 RepID=E4YJL3_OIKDI|nr:unnamed protein product [Oikopleura dioica]
MAKVLKKGLAMPSQSFDSYSSGSIVKNELPNRMASAANDSFTEESSSEKSLPGRQSWGNKIEFMLSMVGYAVGLGNIWRFPYLTYKNGGGAFLIPYLICLVLCGLPIFLFEVALGQFCSQGPIKAFNGVPIFKGIGYAMVAVSTIIGCYYNVIISYTLRYLFESFQAFSTGELPWANCDNSWNDEKCMDVGRLNRCRSIQANGTLEVPAMCQLNHTNREAPSQQYFENHILEMSDSIEDVGLPKADLVLYLAISYAILFICLAKGIQSTGKAVYITSTFPYVVLTTLLIVGLTKDGSLNGIKYFLTPEWERLKDMSVWKDAATQIFFSLSASWGGLITLASYNEFDNNIVRDTLIVVLTNSATSIFAGLTIFSYLGFMAHSMGVEVEDVARQGPGLAFIAYPEALTQISTGSIVWSVLFFTMLLMLGLSTMFATMNTIITCCSDAFPQLRKRQASFTAVLCVFLFLLGIPMTTRAGLYILTLFDDFGGSYALLVISVAEMVSICFIYGLDNFCSDIQIMIKRPVGMFWRICWKFVSPVLLTAVFIAVLANWKVSTLGNYVYPNWTNYPAVGLILFSVLFIPLMAIHHVIKKGSIKAACEPTSHWGPLNSENRLNTRYENRKHFTRDPHRFIDYTSSGQTLLSSGASFVS